MHNSAATGEMQAQQVIGICHRMRLFGECLQRTLTEQDSLVCRLFDPTANLHENSAETTPSLLLLDVAIVAGELGDFVDRIKKQFPLCKLLLLVPESAAQQLVFLTQWGSQGCVRENGSLQELLKAIHLVLMGKQYFAPELANALFSQLNGCDPQQPWAAYSDASCLTPREREVLRLITWEDLGNKQIARRLHVSLYTVKNHVHNIIEKLGCSDRHDAARLARRRNLIGESLTGLAESLPSSGNISSSH